MEKLTEISFIEMDKLFISPSACSDEKSMRPVSRERNHQREQEEEEEMEEKKVVEVEEDEKEKKG